MEFSKNKKLEEVLQAIKSDLLDYNEDLAEIKRYIKDFPKETDYNIAQYGNLLCYYDDITKMYKEAGYKSVLRFSNDKLWETYKKQVGFVARYLVRVAR